jgi:transposase
MSAAVDITRRDHLPAELLALAAKSDDTAQTPRLLAIAMVLQGASRLDAARQTGMDRQTLRDWVHRYYEVGVDGLVSRKPPGAAPKLSEAQTTELRGLVLAGPDPKTDKVVRWRYLDMREEVIQRFSVTVPERTIAKWLRKLELTRLQPRPFHPKRDAAAQEALKKNFCTPLKTALLGSTAATPVEIWFQDEARVGQKGRSRLAPADATRQPSRQRLHLRRHLPGPRGDHRPCRQYRVYEPAPSGDQHAGHSRLTYPLISNDLEKSAERPAF